MFKVNATTLPVIGTPFFAPNHSYLHTHRKKAHSGFLSRADLVKVASKEFGLRGKHQFIYPNTTTNDRITHPLNKIRNIQFFIGRAV